MKNLKSNRINNNLDNIINTINHVDTIQLGEKRMVEYDDIAREMYNKVQTKQDFSEWKRLNRSHIIRYFESTCQKKNIICQECNSGPLKGNFWICKRIPQELMDSMPN